MKATPRDVMACIPFLCFGALMIFVWIAYRQVGHWPAYGSPDPKEVGFEIVPGMRVGEVLRFLLPVIAGPLSFIAVLSIAFSTFSDLAECVGSSRRRIVGRGICQLVVSVIGLLLFWHLLGTLLNWLID